jgi:peptide/nickel transport system substrate-binding protein
MRAFPILIAAVATALVLPGMHTARAAEGDNCVKVLGYENSGQKESMDPVDHASSDDSYRLLNVYDRFVDTDDNFVVKPAIAESWTMSDGGKTWVFKIRQGVKFHSGKDLTAKDVYFTFARIVDPNFPNGAKSVYDWLKAENMKVLDPYTIQFSFDQLRLQEDGSGPFMQEKFSPGGAFVILKRNPNYWGGPAKSECVRITISQEPVQAVAELKSGQVDLVLQVDPSVISTVKDDPNIQLLSTPASNSMTISMMVDTKPFTDVRVRQAMKLSIDRQAMVDTVLLGFGEVGNDNPVPISSPFAYQKEAPQRDIAKAKALLADAGYPNGLDIDLYTAEAIPGMTKEAQVFKEMAADAGIRVNVIVTPSDSYWDNIWLKKSLINSGWNMRSPAEGLSYAYTRSAKYNETHWFREDYDNLLLQAAQTPDADARAELYKKAEKMLADEGGVIIPMFVHQVVAVRKGCSGYQPRAQAYNVRLNDFACGS